MVIVTRHVRMHRHRDGAMAGDDMAGFAGRYRGRETV